MADTIERAATQVGTEVTELYPWTKVYYEDGEYKKETVMPRKAKPQVKLTVDEMADEILKEDKVILDHLKKAEDREKNPDTSAPYSDNRGH